MSPTATCNSCRTIASGTSLDVIEMDAASQRGIDDIREIRDRVVLQPVEGRYKVYILDEAHQLTDAAFNALLKLIEEPPPHLVFVFCTTELGKMLPTVRSRCQTFMFTRPRLPELTRLLRTCGGRREDRRPGRGPRPGWRGAPAEASGTQCRLSTSLPPRPMDRSRFRRCLQLLGAVEEEALFRICDLIVDRDTGGLLTFVEELADQGQDLARLVTDLLEHLRHLLLVQHMGEVPESIPVTDETRERLRSQANQLGEPDVLRLVDLLALAVDDARQGGDPRLPLELALVKVTRPGADLSRESLSYRLAQLESRTREPHHTPAQASAPAAPPNEANEDVRSEAAPAPDEPSERPPLELEQLQQLWQQAILPAVAEHSIPAGSVLNEARPVELSGERLVIEFPPAASFHRNLAEDPKNATLLVDAIREVTGRRLDLAFVIGEGNAYEDAGEHEREPETEEEFIALFKDRFDAREVDGT